MESYNVELTETAEKDLRGIARYISAQFQAPETAVNVIRAIKAKIATLETMAMVYPLVSDDRLASLGYRSVTVKNYTSFYIADEKTKQVDVDCILYSRRDWQNIL